MLTATGLRRSELGPRGRKLVRHKGKQVLVIAEQGRLFAIVDLATGEALVGRRGLRGLATVAASASPPSAVTPPAKRRIALSYAEVTHPFSGPSAPANRRERRAFSPPAREFSGET